MRHDSIARSFATAHSNPRSSVSVATLEQGEGDAPERHLGLFSCINMIVGLMIGAGIFASPGPVLATVGSVGAALLIWLAGGVLCMMGAFCFAELGTMIPKSGGEYQYFSLAYGKLFGLIFSWSTIILTTPIATASIAIVFARYACTLALLRPGSVDVMPEAPEYVIKLVACACVWTVVMLNCISRKSGSQVQNFFTSAKVLALLIIIIIGIIWMAKGNIEQFKNPILGTTKNPLAFGTAMYMALFSYNGFQNLTYSAGEVKNPSRNLPLAIAISCVMVFVLYELANVAYISILPLEVVRTSNTVALQLGVKTMGVFGGYFMALMVCFSAFGAVNAAVYGTARVTATTADEGILFPKFMGRIHPSRGTPIPALVLGGVVTSLWTLPGDFTFLVNIYSFLILVFLLMTGVALLVLRFKMRDLDRPFRVWWPVVVVFSLFCIYLIISPLISGEGGVIQYVASLLGCSLAVPIWFFRAKRPDLLPNLWQSVRGKFSRRGTIHAQPEMSDAKSATPF